MIMMVQRLAERQAEQDRTQGRIDTIVAGLLESEQENIAYTGELTRLAEQISDLTAEDHQRRRAFAAAEVFFYDAESRKMTLRERADALQRSEADLRAEIERHAARLDFLKGLIESREGLPEGVRFLVSSDRWSPSRKLTVADAVHAEEDYRVAIEAALGDLAGLMIVANAGDAARGVELLQEEEKGKAAFVCLDRLPRIVRDYQLPALPGVRGWALDLARFDGEYAPLFAFLLDRVLIVEDSAAAAAVAAVTTGVRCVTLQGEIGTSVGIMRGGSRRHDEGGNIGKQQQMEDIRATIAGIESRLAAVAGERSAVLAKYDAIDLKVLNEEVKSVEKEMHAVEMRIAQVAFEKKRAEETIDENSAQIARLTDRDRQPPCGHGCPPAGTGRTPCRAGRHRYTASHSHGRCAPAVKKNGISGAAWYRNSASRWCTYATTIKPR